ncbi:hypothetical protein GF407_18800 [candidate division KSB1 bacterium]|nr:hypothetical protein [candidate division KSB1 bacterium]
MKRLMMSLLIITLVPVCVLSQLQTREEYQKGFQERFDWFVAHYDTSTRARFNVAAARYYSNNNTELADSLVLEELKEPRGAMFWMYPCIGTYIVGKDKMSDATKQAFRHAWKTYAPTRGDTENHWAMYYASLFLATEQWPGLPGSEWYNGRSSDENRIESKEYLFSWAGLTTSKGQGEFDSPDYLAEYMVAATMLSGFAQDPKVKKLGTMLADYFMADFAAEHLNQQYGGGHSRIYERNLMNFRSSTSTAYAYYYFNAGEPIVSGWIMYPLFSGYKLPHIIYKIANDRSQTYLHKERKRVRHNIRFGPEINPPVYKTTYMTDKYVLGSLHGSLLQPIQQQTWAVRYRYGQPYSMIFGLHPYWSIREIGTFFPEEIKTSMAGITASKTTYNNPDKWTGGSYYEYTFQHKNTLMVLYDIPVGTTSNHIDGFFPANLQQRIVDDSGWIMCKAGDTYVGWYPLQPGEWIPEYELDKQVWNRATGTREKIKEAKLRNYRLRSWELQNGYVVEVRNQAEIGSFESFQQALRKHIPEAFLEPGDVSVSYVNLNGDKLDFKYPDQRRLNGKCVDLSKTPLFQGPYLNADVDSKRLYITYKDESLYLDFERLLRIEK